MIFKDITLKPHQIEYLNIIKKHKGYYFAWGAGSGKTMMASITAGALALKNKATLTVTTPLLCAEYKENLKRFYDIDAGSIADLSTPSGRKKYLNGIRSLSLIHI